MLFFWCRGVDDSGDGGSVGSWQRHSDHPEKIEIFPIICFLLSNVLLAP